MLMAVLPQQQHMVQATTRVVAMASRDTLATLDMKDSKVYNITTWLFQHCLVFQYSFLLSL